jgi:hypothetical protein
MIMYISKIILLQKFSCWLINENILKLLQPYGFDVGESKRGNVLKGLDVGVEGMRVGGQVRSYSSSMQISVFCYKFHWIREYQQDTNEKLHWIGIYLAQDFVVLIHLCIVNYRIIFNHIIFKQYYFSTLSAFASRQ